MLAAQDAWTQAGRHGQTYREGFDAAEDLASAVIDGAYGYQAGPSPSSRPGRWQHTFRTDKAGALSYFVGGNDDYDDLGFAIGSEPNADGDRFSWVDAWSENAVIRLDGDTATSWVGFTEDAGGDGTSTMELKGMTVLCGLSCTTPLSLTPD